MAITKYILDYYGGEVNAGKVLLGIGALMIGLSYLVTITVKGEVGYGILFGLLPLAVFQLLAGLVILVKKTVKQNKLARDFDANQDLDLKSEASIMSIVVKRFTITRHIQEALCLLSFIAIFLGMAKIIGPLGMGLSMAVLLQSAIMIAFDLFALRRAEEYLRRLERVNKG